MLDLFKKEKLNEILGEPHLNIIVSCRNTDSFSNRIEAVVNT